MHNLPKHKILLAILFIVVCMYACKKQDYLNDGGVHSAVTELTPYDYLATHQYKYFDTVIQIIDHFNLKDSVNKSGTFFAPTDYSVSRTMTALGVTDLNGLYARISSKFITQYLFADYIALDNATVNGKIYSNWADTITNIKKLPQSYGSVSSTFNYYVLQYVKINGYPDNSPDAPAGDLIDYSMNCQTTGIITKTHTTVHILANTSSLAIK